MVGKLGVVFSDSCYRVADRPSYRDTGALRRGCGSSIATSQADRARQFAHDELALSVGLLFAPSVIEGARVLDVLFNLREAPAVSVLRSLVEQLTRIA